MASQPQKKFNILLIGDAGDDVYTYGYVNRISPEAPVPVFEPHYTIHKDGMAGNVCKNLEALGCKVNFLHGEVSKKNRLIDHRSKQQLLRIDHDVESTPIRFETAIPPVYDAVVISDYNKGTVPTSLIEWVRQEYKGPVFIDTKKTDLAKFNGCYIKINQLEKSLAKTLPNDEWLIVTKGDNGADYLGHNFKPDVSDDVIDVCGAGDTFLAALVYR